MKYAELAERPWLGDPVPIPFHAIEYPPRRLTCPDCGNVVDLGYLAEDIPLYCEGCDVVRLVPIQEPS